MDRTPLLNPEQQAAAGHGLEPLLVIAGAGTGKTLTLAARVVHLVRQGVDPQRLLLLTFSRRAAQELEGRVGRALHRELGLAPTTPPPRLPWCGTFHSVAARLLRDLAPSLGLAETFTIHDRGDAEDLMALVRLDLGLAQAARRFPAKGTCLAIYSRVVNARQPLEDVIRDQYPWCLGWEDELKRLLRGYVAEKQRQQVLDFDDLLLYWQQAMAEPALARAVGARYDHVLVDEYQDTNRLQAEILHALKPDGRGLTVVGDDAQSIYAFRGAELRNILDFPARCGAATRVLTLSRNYRSTQPILDAANAVIARAAERHAKNLWCDTAGARPCLVAVAGEREQARWVADQVLLQRESGLALKQQAVLFRSAQHSAALELELARRGIPYLKYGGLAFLEAAHVKDLLSVLRWVHNPRSRLAGLRVALLLPGLGPAAARRLLEAVEQHDDPVQALRGYAAPAAARAAWQGWVAARDALAAGAWPEQVEIALRWYRPHLQRLHDAVAQREADLAQLARLAGAYPSRERFLAELTLDPPQATSDEAADPGRDEDYLVLSTMHSAKGQEWSAVYLLNMVDGCMPADLATGSAAEIEEERRLLHVAMTRARRHLALVVPQRFHVTQQARLGDRHVYASRTRFIPDELLGLFDEVVDAADRGAEAAAPEPGLPAIDLAARVRQLF